MYCTSILIKIKLQYTVILSILLLLLTPQKDGSNVDICQWLWDDDTPTGGYSGQFEVILGADITYDLGMKGHFIKYAI